MTIRLDPKLEAAMAKAAEKAGVDPESLAINVLREKFLSPASIQPRDEWEARLLELATDCGVSLPDEAVSREQLYD